jgi:hypothetical protein
MEKVSRIGQQIGYPEGLCGRWGWMVGFAQTDERKEVDALSASHGTDGQAIDRKGPRNWFVQIDPKGER